MDALVRVVTIVLRYFYKSEGVCALLSVLPSRMVVNLLKKHGATIGNDVRIQRGLSISTDTTEDSAKYRVNFKHGLFMVKEIDGDLKVTGHF